MATPAQIDANRANAQLSTGPVSVEGKARVAQNALKHGLTSQRLVVRDDEQDEFAALRDSLYAQVEPETALEAVAFDELLHAAWNLHRFRRLEAEASKGTLEDLTDPKTSALLDRLARYQARAQRAYSRALAELRILQTDRTMRELQFDGEFSDSIPALTDIPRLTKQSQWPVIAQALNLPFAAPPSPPRGAPVSQRYR